MTARQIAFLSLPILLATAALALLFQVVLAYPASQNRFAAADGSGGGACQQANPCPLSAALAGANTGDTIYVKQGTYTGSGSAVITVTKTITLYGGWFGNPTGQPVRSPGIFVTNIDGQGLRRGVFVSHGISPTIDGFVIRNGNASGLVNGCSMENAAGCGGGMFVDRAAASILHNVFFSNTALISTTDFIEGHGGGIYLEWGDGSVISANTFLSNNATLPLGQSQGDGGGLAVTGFNANSLLVQNNTFSGNTAYWGGGAALNGVEDVQVQGNLFQQNTAIQGGGLYLWYATAGASGNTFRGNIADEPAYLGYANGQFAGNLVVDNSTSAGLDVVNSNPAENELVYNNIIAHNGNQGIVAHSYAGNPLTVYLINNTVVGNGSGTGLLLADGDLTATAFNNLFSGFSTGVSVSFPLTTNANMYYTLLDNNIGAAGNAVFSQTVIGWPAFVDPTHRNYHIQFNSAARDSGQVTIISTDFDGDLRPLGAHNDIGADETRFQYGVFLPSAQR